MMTKCISYCVTAVLILASTQSVVEVDGRLLAGAKKTTTTLQQSDPALLLPLVQFHEWATQHDKSYVSDEDKMKRFQVWLENDQRIQQHNSQLPKPTYFLGHNAYSDMSQDEFRSYFRLDGSAIPPSKSKKESISSTDVEAKEKRFRRLLTEKAAGPLKLPDYVNWVEWGAVTPVKNQGSCGSCWAFSTTGALEGAKFIKTGELVALSEQNLLDCDHQDLGCSGGLMDTAFKFDEKSGGLCAEADYPYEAKVHDTCFTNCTDVPGSIVQTFIDVPPGNRTALLAAIAMQPISIAIQASQFTFQFYKTGVITDDSCGSSGAIDHGVLAVGYGTDLETNEPYFLVKNSWGETWGDAGFVKIGRMTKNHYGICSILKLASFPVTMA